MRKHLRLILFAGFAGLLLFSAMLTAGIGQPGTIKEIVKGVWFREGELLDKGHCNNVIIEMKDYLIVVDANFIVAYCSTTTRVGCRTSCCALPAAWASDPPSSIKS